MGPIGRATRKRKREEKAAAYDRAVAVLRSQGASCGNCQHRGKAFGVKGPICDLDSDFQGYSLVKMDHLCDRWKATTPNQEPSP